MSPEQRLAWNNCKTTGLDLFAPERGGSWEVFNQRPMPRAIVDYCVQDVEILPRLYNSYNWKIPEERWALVKEATEDRIAESQAADFNGKGPHMALSPSNWKMWR